MSTTCGDELFSVTSDKVQYNYTGVTAYLELNLAEGNQSVVNHTMCTNSFLAILNDCPPFSAPSGSPLMKYGGGYIIKDGMGGMVNFNITMDSNVEN